MDLKEKVLKTLEDYGKSMSFKGLLGGFFEEHGEFAIKEAIWQLIDEKKILFTYKRRLVAEKNMTKLRKKVLKTLKGEGPINVTTLKEKLFKEEDEGWLNHVIRRLIESGEVYVDIDWKIKIGAA